MQSVVVVLSRDVCRENNDVNNKIVGLELSKAQTENTRERRENAAT